MKIDIQRIFLLLVTTSSFAAQQSLQHAQALKRSYVEAFEPELFSPLSASTTSTDTVDFFELQRTYSPSPLAEQAAAEMQLLITGESPAPATQIIEVTSSSSESTAASQEQNTTLGTDEEIDAALHTFVARAYNCCVKDKNDEITAAWIIALETEDAALIKKIFVSYFQRYYIDVNYQNSNGGKTALILATQAGDFEFVIALTLCEGAFLNLRDHEGKNAQFYALLHKRADIAQFLLNLEQSYKQMIA